MANTGVILFLIDQATYLYQREPGGVRRNFEFPVLCDLSRSQCLRFVFTTLKRQAKISPQTNVFHDLSWRFCETREGLQVPTSLLSEGTVLINICSSVLTLHKAQQLLLGIIYRASSAF